MRRRSLAERRDRPSPNIDTVGESSLTTSGCWLESGEVRMAGSAWGRARPPLTKPDHVDCGSGGDVLQVRPGETDVARLAHPTASDALGMGALDSSAGRVPNFEGLGLLALSRSP